MRNKLPSQGQHGIHPGFITIFFIRRPTWALSFWEHLKVPPKVTEVNPPKLFMAFFCTAQQGAFFQHIADTDIRYTCQPEVDVGVVFWESPSDFFLSWKPAIFTNQLGSPSQEYPIKNASIKAIFNQESEDVIISFQMTVYVLSMTLPPPQQGTVSPADIGWCLSISQCWVALNLRHIPYMPPAWFDQNQQL